MPAINVDRRRAGAPRSTFVVQGGRNVDRRARRRAPSTLRRPRPPRARPERRHERQPRLGREGDRKARVNVGTLADPRALPTLTCPTQVNVGSAADPRMRPTLTPAIVAPPYPAAVDVRSSGAPAINVDRRCRAALWSTFVFQGGRNVDGPGPLGRTVDVAARARPKRRDEGQPRLGREGDRKACVDVGRPAPIPRLPTLTCPVQVNVGTAADSRERPTLTPASVAPSYPAAVDVRPPATPAINVEPERQAPASTFVSQGHISLDDRTRPHEPRGVDAAAPRGAGVRS